MRPLFGGVFGKRQKAYFLTLHGHHFKRLILGDAWQAERIERELERFQGENGFPPLIVRHENELLLRYVDGRPFDPADPADREALARFYARLYRKSPRRESAQALPLTARLHRDLRFLADVGVLDQPDVPALQARAASLQPDQVWLGYDYVDPVAKNFVLTDAGMVAVDVESLVSDEVLGTGIAKARVHWLADAQTKAFLEAIASAGGPDLGAQLPWVELCFLAGWTKRKVLQGKHGFVQPPLLKRFITSEAAP
ncbi:MAG: hypothetical protein U5R46_04045 [Gammaproteobacteria bacterium]|nr:hypothetical protein [Gammaproteobacteria bacterium]